MTFEPAPFPLQDHLGMTISSSRPGQGLAELDVVPPLHNPNGVVHGAVLFAMVDTAMGAATMSSLAEGLVCASIEVHLRFLRAVSAGRLRAEATVVKGGRRVVQLDARVADDTGTLVATASGSFAVIAPTG